MKTAYIVSAASKFIDEGIDVNVEKFDTVGAASSYIAGQWLRELQDQKKLIIVPKEGEGMHYKAIDLESGDIVGECNRDYAWISIPGEYAWDGCWEVKEVRV